MNCVGRTCYFYTRWQNWEKRLLASSCLSVRPSVRMEQLGSHWTDFRIIGYLSILRKSVDVIQVSLKSHKNNGYFTWRPMYIFSNISLNSSCDEMFQTKFLEKMRTHFVFSNVFPKRKRGRPKQTWRRSVHNEALGEGKSWGEVKQLARNRIRWRRFVDALCP